MKIIGLPVNHCRFDHCVQIEFCRHHYPHALLLDQVGSHCDVKLALILEISKTFQSHLNTAIDFRFLTVTK